MKNRNPRPHVVLRLPKPVPNRIKSCRATTTAMKQNASTFPGSAALVAKTDADLDLLTVKETAVKTGAHGAADDRDLQLGVVDVDMDQIRETVQHAVDANPAQAEAIVAQAALHLDKRASHGPQRGAVHYGGTAGAIHVTLPVAGRNAAYLVQVSVDGGKTWGEPVLTDLAHAHLTGLPVGVTVLVRWRSSVHGVVSDWSEPVSFVVR